MKRCKKLLRGLEVEVLSWDCVHVVCDLVTVILGYVLHGFLLGEESSDYAVMAFIGSTFTGAVGVTVVDLRDDGFEGVVVTEFASIVGGYTLECAGWVLGG